MYFANLESSVILSVAGDSKMNCGSQYLGHSSSHPAGSVSAQRPQGTDAHVGAQPSADQGEKSVLRCDLLLEPCQPVVQTLLIFKSCVSCVPPLAPQSLRNCRRALESCSHPVHALIISLLVICKMSFKPIYCFRLKRGIRISLLDAWHSRNLFVSLP